MAQPRLKSVPQLGTEPGAPDLAAPRPWHIHTEDESDCAAARGLYIHDRDDEPVAFTSSANPEDTALIVRAVNASRPVPAPEPSARLRDALEQARDRFESMGNHMKPDLTAADRESLATDWWFGMQEVEAALAATPQDPEETR